SAVEAGGAHQARAAKRCPRREGHREWMDSPRVRSAMLVGWRWPPPTAYLVTRVSSRERLRVRSESAGTGASSIHPNMASTMRRQAATWRSIAEPQYAFDQPAPASQPAMAQQKTPVPSFIQPRGPTGERPISVKMPRPRLMIVKPGRITL